MERIANLPARGEKGATLATAHPRLTKTQLDALRAKLEKERRRILSVLREPLPSMPEGEPQELEEAAQRATELDDRLGVEGPESALLADIDRALAKMNAGTYGMSEKTGAPIPYERLEAIPWARQGADE